MAPDNLRRAARRLLEPLSQVLADAHEDGLLREQEREAECYAEFVLADNGDGSWTGRFVIPELHAHVLKTALERLSSPRRYTRGKDGELVEDPTVSQRPNGLTRAESMAAAFMELVEHLPQTGHARSGMTVVVHVEEQKLRDQVGAATLETGASISGFRTAASGSDTGGRAGGRTALIRGRTRGRWQMGCGRAPPRS